MEGDQTELDARMARLRILTAPARFEAGFADRVMARLGHQPSLADGLQVSFLRLAPLAAAAVLILAAINLLNTRSSEQSFVDRVLELPAVDLSTAYSLETEVAAWKEVRP